MTTIRVNTVAVPMELEVNTTPDQIIRAFDTSLHEVIERVVREHVGDGLKHMVSEPDYVRSVRDWVMESLDYSYLSERIAREYSMSEIVEEIMGNFGGDDMFMSDQFQERLVRNTRFQLVVQRYVQEHMNTASSLRDMIDDSVQRYTANLANEVADRVLVIISQRLNGGSDV